MSSLYNIQEEYQYILQMLEANEGELTEADEEALLLNDKNFEEKAKSYRAMIFKWKADINAAKEESERIAAFKKNRENSIQRLTESLDQAMRHRGLTKLDMGLFGKISYRSSKKVIITNEDLLTEDWVNIKETRTPDKKAIGDALKKGLDVEGAYLEENSNIQIK